jgi:hypothetical protein
LWKHKKLNKCKPKLTIERLNKRVRDLNKKIKTLEGMVTLLTYMVSTVAGPEELKWAQDKFLIEGNLPFAD